MEQANQMTPGPALIGAIRRVLRPLVRLLIAKAISFPSLAEILKGLYVEVAVSDFPVEGRPQTDSRVNLLTGVHRKDVKRLRQNVTDDFATPKRASLGSQIIARWTTDAAWQDDAKQPRPLPRLADDEGDSFEDLVRSINTDIRPRVVFDELARLGVVELDEEGRVQLRVEAFVPEEGSEELAYYFGRNLHDHVACGVHNLLGEEPRLLERSVYYNNLSAGAVAELESLARTRGMETLQEVNRRALELQKRDSGTPGAQHRMNFGLYFHKQDDERGRSRAPREAGEDA